MIRLSGLYVIYSLFLSASAFSAPSNLELIISDTTQTFPATSISEHHSESPSETLRLLDQLISEDPGESPQSVASDSSISPLIKSPAYIFNRDDEIGDDNCIAVKNGSVYSFKQALAVAICNNPQMRSMSLKLRSYLLEYKKSMSSWMPEIDFVSSISAEQERYKIKSLGGYTTRDRKRDTGLEINWLLFDFGKREALIEQKKDIWLSQNYQALFDFQSFVVDFSRTYYQAISKKEILVAARANEDLAQKTWTVTQNKFESGIGAYSDTLQAKNVLLSAIQYRREKEGEYQQVIGHLASAMNMPVISKLTPQERVAIHASRQVTKLQRLLNLAAVHHPLILSARKKIDSAQHSLQQARLDFMPTISMQAAAYRGISSLDEHQPPFVNKTDTMFVALKLSVPLFSGFQRYHQLQEANVLMRNSQEEYKMAVKNIELGVWDAWQNLNTTTRSLELIAQRVTTAQRAYDIANGRYLTGVGNIIELLNAQKDLSTAQIDSANMKSSWCIQKVELLASVGELSMF
ncbi:hypothetical protein GIX45_07855 [Erwinia sp. CPCC 100877]|nr:hypothetical protein [Erwinia sp. CPCC 100877]